MPSCPMNYTSKLSLATTGRYEASMVELLTFIWMALLKTLRDAKQIDTQNQTLLRVTGNFRGFTHFFHTLGAVADCALHLTQAGHESDAPIVSFA
jgi:hypothetical protein